MQSYADTSIHTIKSPLISPYKTSFQSIIEEIQRKYLEQLKATENAVDSYNQKLMHLKQIEALMVQELNRKGINAEDPDLDVDKVFLITRNERSRARKQLKEKLKNQELIKDIWTEIKQEENIEEIQNTESKPCVIDKEELDLIFCNEQNFFVEHESEYEVPYIPLAISQVFS